MNAVEIIEKKRDGGRLSPEELTFFMNGLVKGEIADYQASAWCMAVYLRGMDEEETAAMTRAMIATGSLVDLSSLSLPTVDKHSTGGVGDKTTLVLGPVMASLGAAMVKMSGRALGHTGGTLDKLESIPGLRTDLPLPQIMEQAGRIGLAIVSQTADLVPADKILYAIRDVTATVGSIPLIAASIMAKKIAAGAGAIVLDVKYGSGSFLPRPEDARSLGRLMAWIGRTLGRKVGICLSSMEQPLGRAVGNALEVKEAIETLRGGGPDDLRELAISLAAELSLLAGLTGDRSAAIARAARAIDDGTALAKFAEMVAAQGGDPEAIERPERLPTAKATTIVAARAAGYLAGIDTAALGRIAVRLGAGRLRKDDRIDPAAGLILLVRLGDRIEPGQPLAQLHTNRLAEIEPAQEKLRASLTLSPEPVPRSPLLLPPDEDSAS